jgi:hypothetical protein
VGIGETDAELADVRLADLQKPAQRRSQSPEAPRRFEDFYGTGIMAALLRVPKVLCIERPLPGVGEGRGGTEKTLAESYILVQRGGSTSGWRVLHNLARALTAKRTPWREPSIIEEADASALKCVPAPSRSPKIGSASAVLVLQESQNQVYSFLLQGNFYRHAARNSVIYGGALIG